METKYPNPAWIGAKEGPRARALLDAYGWGPA